MAADYSQLELRLFAHLSDDTDLLQILNRESGDVFKLIAAKWKGITETEVTDEDRQRAKQICYGKYEVEKNKKSEICNDYYMITSYRYVVWHRH